MTRIPVVLLFTLACASSLALGDEPKSSPGLVIVTADTGTRITIEPSAVLRIRGITASEQVLHPEAATLIDYAVTLYARDKPEVVVEMIAAGKDALKLGKLVLPNGAPLWFDGRRAQGPLPIPPDYRKHSVNSALSIAGRVQYVRSSPAEVFNVLSEIRGSTLPFTQSAARGSLTEAERAALEKRLTWDADIPEFNPGPRH